jgi:glycosyltransferase involved in cell wall biosynthesis
MCLATIIFAFRNGKGNVLKTAVCTVVRNELDIAEWLAYQHVVGFDTVILFDNGSTDNTLEVAHAFSHYQDVRIIPWDNRTQTWQISAFNAAKHLFRYEFDWIAFFDADEFLVLDKEQPLHTLLEDRQAANGIMLSWAMYGSNGHRVRPSGLVIENFFHRAPPTAQINGKCKSIIRPGEMSDCTNPHWFKGNNVTASGLKAEWTEGGIRLPPELDKARINHYVTRSWEHWEIRMNRKYPNPKTRALLTTRRFDELDTNEIFDPVAARFASAVRTQMMKVCKSLTTLQKFPFID